MAYFYFLPTGASIEGAQPVISMMKAGNDSRLLDVTPGTYNIVILSPGANWKVMDEDLAPARS